MSKSAKEGRLVCTRVTLTALTATITYALLFEHDKTFKRGNGQGFIRGDFQRSIKRGPGFVSFMLKSNNV